MKHQLKTWTYHFQAIKKGIKTFEIRKNDRDFRVGDTLILEEYFPDAGEYGCDSIAVNVTHILAHDDFPDGIKPGYVVMSIQIEEQEEKCQLQEFEQ